MLSVGFPGSSVVNNHNNKKNLLAKAGERVGRFGFDPSVKKIPWRGKWQPSPVFLPKTCLIQRSLAGYGPWGHKELIQLSTVQQQYLY